MFCREFSWGFRTTPATAAPRGAPKLSISPTFFPHQCRAEHKGPPIQSDADQRGRRGRICQGNAPGQGQELLWGRAEPAPFLLCPSTAASHLPWEVSPNYAMPRCQTATPSTLNQTGLFSLMIRARYWGSNTLISPIKGSHIFNPTGNLVLN